MKKIGVMILLLLVSLASYAGGGKPLVEFLGKHAHVGGKSGRQFRGGVVPKKVTGKIREGKIKEAKAGTRTRLHARNSHSYTPSKGDSYMHSSTTGGKIIRTNSDGYEMTTSLAEEAEGRRYLKSTTVTGEYEFQLGEPWYMEINREDFQGNLTFGETFAALVEHVNYLQDYGGSRLEADPQVLAHDIAALRSRLQVNLDETTTELGEKTFLTQYGDEFSLVLQVGYEPYADWMKFAKKTLAEILGKLDEQSNNPDQVILTDLDMEISFAITLEVLEEVSKVAVHLKKGVPEEMQHTYEAVKDVATYLFKELFGKEGNELVAPGFEEGVESWLQEVRGHDFEAPSVTSSEGRVMNINWNPEEADSLQGMGAHESGGPNAVSQNRTFAEKKSAGQTPASAQPKHTSQQLYIIHENLMEHGNNIARQPAIVHALDEVPFWDPVPVKMAEFVHNYYEPRRSTDTHELIATPDEMYSAYQDLTVSLRPVMRGQREYLFEVTKSPEYNDIDGLVREYNRVIWADQKIRALVSMGMRTDEYPAPLSDMDKSLRSLAQFYKEYIDYLQEMSPSSDVAVKLEPIKSAKGIMEAEFRIRALMIRNKRAIELVDGGDVEDVWWTKTKTEFEKEYYVPGASTATVDELYNLYIELSESTRNFLKLQKEFLERFNDSQEYNNHMDELVDSYNDVLIFRGKLNILRQNAGRDPGEYLTPLADVEQALEPLEKFYKDYISYLKTWNN